jgi:hypothetical protein
MLQSLRYPGLAFVLLFLTAALPSVAQIGSSSSRHSKTVTHASPAPDQGTFTDGVYRNRTFGFSYKVPYGWVDRTSQMRQGASDLSGSLLLLSAFERPPEAAGDTVNSSVLIAAETVSSYPGLKDPSQYFRPLTEVTTSKGFKVIHEPYDVEVGGKRLVRADFSKELGKLTMHQSTLAVIEKGYVLSFTVIGGSEDEVDELIENLQWTSGHPGP